MPVARCSALPSSGAQGVALGARAIHQLAAAKGQVGRAKIFDGPLACLDENASRRRTSAPERHDWPGRRSSFSGCGLRSDLGAVQESALDEVQYSFSREFDGCGASGLRSVEQQAGSCPCVRAARAGRSARRRKPPGRPRATRPRRGLGADAPGTRPLLSRRHITIIVVDNADPHACPRKAARGEVDVRADARRR